MIWLCIYLQLCVVALGLALLQEGRGQVFWTDLPRVFLFPVIFPVYVAHMFLSRSS